MAVLWAWLGPSQGGRRGSASEPAKLERERERERERESGGSPEGGRIESSSVPVGFCAWVHTLRFLWVHAI